MIMTGELNMPNRKVLPPTYFYTALLVILGLHLLCPLARLIEFPWNLCGLLPFAAGSILNIIADQAFKKAGTTVKPFEESSALITSGIFRFSRNPMYLGMVLIHIGAAILLGSLSPYIMVVIFTLLIQWIFIIPEEKALEAKFGQDYLQYKQKVRQWF
jgi:protein-S-isoprenylcysteine O-methyltransferase Ste14